MIPRRDVATMLAGGVLGVIAGAGEASPAPAEAPPPEVADTSVREIAAAVDRLRGELREQHDFRELTPIRDAQRSYLRANNKFPDAIEVGADVWFSLHDWYVRWQQPLTIGRDAQGRYTIAVLGTAVILRGDGPPNFVGLPFDNR